MRRGTPFALAALVAALTAPAALAQGLGPNLAPAAGSVIAEPPPAIAITVPLQPIDERVAFNHAERWIIPTYFERVREKQRRAARSKKYVRALPAGITHQPAKGEVLPLPLLASLERLPGPLVRGLPPNRPETDRIVVAKDVLMVNTATGEVLDILPNILH
ncbi:MAG: hypothetical protein VW600_11830 [Ferrovibrio sp.]